MSAPRTKRQFAGASSDPAQRQITAFFSATSPATNADKTDNPARAHLNSPALPSSVQSNLLSVGMRVRKSVPEGYKTNNAFSSFALWSESDAPSPNLSTSAPPSTVIGCDGTSPPRRELAPFCGIHKVGGLSVQPPFTSDYLSVPGRVPGLPAPAVPGIDDVPGLTSSQESVEGSSAGVGGNSPTRPRKRFYEDKDEDGADAHDPPLAVHNGPRVRRDEWLDGEVSPRSLAPAGWQNARVLAVPRRSRRKQAGAAAMAMGFDALGQENMAVDDFDDAEFLDYRWQDMEMQDA